jgi:hypothetical protein
MQWIGHKERPLSPDQTLRAVAKVLKPYGLDDCITIGDRAATLSGFAERHGLMLVDDALTSSDRVATVKAMLVPLSHGTLELPLSKQLRQDLVGVRTRTTLNGSEALTVVKTADGRVSDYVVPLATACSQYPDFPEEDVVDFDPIYTEHMAQLSHDDEDGVDAAAARLL